MNRKVCLLPKFKTDTVGGVHHVISSLGKHLPKYGWEVTNDPSEADIIHGHAVCNPKRLDVYTSHGVYPMSDHMPGWQHRANRIMSCDFKMAQEVTTVSTWTAGQWAWWEGIDPHIIYNFIDLDLWDNIEGDFQTRKPYALWAKIKPYPGIGETLKLAKHNPNFNFVVTVVPDVLEVPLNVTVVGVLPFEQMQLALKDCAVYLSLCAVDNFPAQILEAMALGKPILTFATGGIPEAVRHKQEGYVIGEVNMYEVQKGFEYCLEHAAELGRNARKRVEQWFSVGKVVPQYVAIYEQVLSDREKRKKLPKCSIVITTHNFEEFIGECIDSALAQDYDSFEVLVVDDGSNDGTWDIIKGYGDKVRVKRFQQSAGKIHGIVRSRNMGVQLAKGEFVACLDGDDKIRPDFLSKLVPALEEDGVIGIAYSDFEVFGTQKGIVHTDEFDFEQLKKGNFIPCCNLFRKKAWQRAGGCKPVGESWEDYGIWLTITERGWGAKKVKGALFLYRKRGEEGRDFESRPHIKRLRAVVDAYHPAILPPTVSVIIPCYDHEKYLKEAIDSVFDQHYQDFEIIVVDDGSPGDPKAIIDEYWDPRLKLIQQENQGLSAARNAGIAQARGKYILPLDADDRLAPMFLEKAVKIQKDKGKQVAVYSDFTAFWDTGEESEQQLDDYDFEKLLGHALMPCTVLYPKVAWAQAGGYKPVMKDGYEDWEFAISIGERGYFGVRIPECLFYYRQHAGTSMRDIIQANEGAKAKEAKAIIQRLHQATYAKEERPSPSPQEVKAAAQLRRRPLDSFLAQLPEEEPKRSLTEPVKLKYTGKKEWGVSYTILGKRYDVSISEPFITVPPKHAERLLKLHFVEA